jgi:hypothetical protein
MKRAVMKTNMTLKMERDVIVEAAKPRCSVKNRQKSHPTPTIVMESGVSLFEVPAGQGASTPYSESC